MRQMNPYIVRRRNFFESCNYGLPSVLLSTRHHCSYTVCDMHSFSHSYLKMRKDLKRGMTSREERSQ